MAKQEFVNEARQGNILAVKCAKCSMLQLGTVYFCSECGSKEFVDEKIKGRGTVATYTIITVPPAGFESYAPYAWAVVKLDGVSLRVSGFMAGIASTSDLPVGCRVKVTGFDERGIILEKE